MGDCLSRFRTVTIDVIPDKAVMLDIVDRIVMFEEMLKSGETLSQAQEEEKKALEPVANEIRRVQAKEGTVVKRQSVTVN